MPFGILEPKTAEAVPGTGECTETIVKTYDAAMLRAILGQLSWPIRTIFLPSTTSCHAIC